MNKLFYRIIACLLIPSFVFAQPYPSRSNGKYIKQIDLSQLSNALDTEVGKEIVTYVETTMGSIDIEHAKAFHIYKSDVAFVPIRTFNKTFAALCYTHVENGSEFLYLIAFDEKKKTLSYSFPSGKMYLLKSSGGRESINPDFQFQQYDDLNNTINITATGDLYNIICAPFMVGAVFILAGFTAGAFLYGIFGGLLEVVNSFPSFLEFWSELDTNNQAIAEMAYLFFILITIPVLLIEIPIMAVILGIVGGIVGLEIIALFPLILGGYIDSTYPSLNAEMISIIVGIYWYGCILLVPSSDSSYVTVLAPSHSQ